jgi:hypothetical protein
MSLAPLELQAGELTPYILLDAEKKVCMFKGRCIPENPNQYFLSILNWIEGLKNLKNDHLDIICKIQYFNTASAKYLLEIFKRLETVAIEGGNKITLNWYYETDDDDMKEAGEHFADLVKLPFNLTELSEEEFDS